MFSGCTVLPVGKETKLGISNLEASPSDENTGIVLVPCLTWKCVFTAVFGCVGISELPWCHLLWQMSPQWGSQKLLHKLVSHELTAYLSVFKCIFNSMNYGHIMKKDINIFELHNSLKRSFTNIRVLHSNFVECKSFRESDSPDILALCVTNLDDAVDSGNFFVRGYLPLIQKDGITHMHGLPVYVEEGLSFCMGPISRKLCRFLLMFSTDFISLSVFFLFPLLITFFVAMHNFWFYFI